MGLHSRAFSIDKTYLFSLSRILDHNQLVFWSNNTTSCLRKLLCFEASWAQWLITNRWIQWTKIEMHQPTVCLKGWLLNSVAYLQLPDRCFNTTSCLRKLLCFEASWAEEPRRSSSPARSSPSHNTKTMIPSTFSSFSFPYCTWNSAMEMT